MKKIIVIIIAAILATTLYMKNSNYPMVYQNKEQFLIQENSLILVNKKNKLHVETISLVKLNDNFADNVTINETFYVEEQLVNPLSAMFKAAKKDGIDHFIINSTYRSNKEQAQIYKQKGSDYALPAGYSEHETGLAVDIGSTLGMMENSEEGKWLAEHASNYGFILRYPENKEHITQISYEPWHFRYVGLPHSIIMEEEDMVLEQYIAWIKEKGEVNKNINGIKYNIKYFHNLEASKEFATLQSVTSFIHENDVVVTTIK